jgi:hypothetical protein
VATKRKSLKWTEHVVRMDQTGVAKKGFESNSEDRIKVGKPRYDWEMRVIYESFK